MLRVARLNGARLLHLHVDEVWRSADLSRVWDMEFPHRRLREKFLWISARLTSVKLFENR